MEEETYHIFNRGANKQEIFHWPVDYDRFMLLLYISNTSENIHLSTLLRNKDQGRSLIEAYNRPIDKALVDVLAYALMPNHFHLILKQKSAGGITLFMKKLATAYAMYFNIAHEHSGVVFQGRFQSRLVDTDPYYRWLFSYVHLNPVDLVEPGWKERGITNIARSRAFINDYRYSSYTDLRGVARPESSILTFEAIPTFIKKSDDLEDMLKWERRGRVLYDQL